MKRVAAALLLALLALAVACRHRPSSGLRVTRTYNVYGLVDVSAGEFTWGFDRLESIGVFGTPRKLAENVKAAVGTDETWRRYSIRAEPHQGLKPPPPRLVVVAPDAIQERVRQYLDALEKAKLRPHATFITD